MDNIVQSLGHFLPFVMMGGVFYFLMLRPQQKKVDLHKTMLSHLKKGDEVVTTGGILGLVESIVEEDVRLKVAESTIITIRKAHIAERLSPQEKSGLGSFKNIKKSKKLHPSKDLAPGTADTPHSQEESKLS